MTPGFEAVYYNAEHNFTLQYPVLLAPLRIDDSDEELRRKVQITAAFLDILLYRRIWNWRAIDYSTMQYAMFLVMREIRGKDSGELAALLRQRLDGETETFLGNDGFRLHGMNARQIHRLLARMTDYIEAASGMPSRYSDYSKRGGKDGYEIEHVWADHFERHVDEFDHPSDFSEYRNRIGDLVLLPKSFNASYGDLAYEEKLKHYNGQNLLARSLHKGASAYPVCSGSLAGMGDELTIGGWGMASCEPEQRLERRHRRMAAVVAEHVLIEVDGQVLVRDVAVSSVHPCLQVADGAVRTR